MTEESEQVVIKVREHGPYKVTGPVTLTDAAGTPLPLPEGSLVLCRCGRSRTKPYCDSSHAREGGTTCVHAGLPPARDGEPLFPSPVFAAPFHFSGDPGEGGEPFYGRYANPTWDGWERAIGDLEGGEAVAFASGMAAIAAVLLTTLRAGDVLVAPSDGYYTVRTLAERHLEPRGVEVRLVPTDDAAIRDALPGATLLWIESPSNPALDVVDIAALASVAREAGTLVAVDNTLATPLRQRPLELGADLAVASATKQLSGHSDVLLGYVATREPARLEDLRSWRTETGAIPGPFETWLAHRSLATLAVRVDRQEATAAEVVRMLASRDDVHEARWPGLGCVIALDLVTAARAQAFLEASELVAEATSFGGVHSSGERRARWGGDDVSPGLVRLSIGLEDVRDLVADLAAALDAARGVSRPRRPLWSASRWPVRPLSSSAPTAATSPRNGTGSVPAARRGTRSPRSARRRRAPRPYPVAGAAAAPPARRAARSRCVRSRPTALHGSRPASGSSTACSAAGWSPARWSCSAARRASASRR